MSQRDESFTLLTAVQWHSGMKSLTLLLLPLNFTNRCPMAQRDEKMNIIYLCPIAQRDEKLTFNAGWKVEHSRDEKLNFTNSCSIAQLDEMLNFT